MKIGFYLGLTLIFLLSSPAEAGETYGPLSGHSIRVDGTLSSWVGTAPEQPNSGAISKGEFIWKDAYDDDTGNGKYTYPNNPSFTKAADLEEFRVTCDDKNVYFLIKTARPGDWWAPFRVIAIDTSGSAGGKRGTQVIQQGDMDTLDADTGAFCNLRVAPPLSIDYVITIAGTYKVRIWDSSGKLVAKARGEKTDTPGIKIKDFNVSAVEMQVPQKIIGNPRGKVWKFIVACGLEDNEHAREVRKTTDEWHGRGGADNGENPNIYDLASPNTTTQERELGSFDVNARPRDPKGFAAIQKSYLEVRFSPFLNMAPK